MNTIEESVEVEVPVATAYNQWTQFETFPSFMGGIEKITQLDETHLHWVAKIAGRQEEWDAEIVEQVPDTRIAWRDCGRGSPPLTTRRRGRCAGSGRRPVGRRRAWPRTDVSPESISRGSVTGPGSLASGSSASCSWCGSTRSDFFPNKR